MYIRKVELTMQKQKALRVLRLPELREKVGLGTSKIYEMIADGEFPAPRKITGRAVGWLEYEIDEWLLSRPVAAR